AVGAATLMACMAAMPVADGSRPRPFITNEEKAKNTPADSPAPRAATKVSRSVMAISRPDGGKTDHGSRAQFHVRASTVWRMDALVGLLDEPRARGAFLLRAVMDPPWS